LEPPTPEELPAEEGDCETDEAVVPSVSNEGITEMNQRQRTVAGVVATVYNTQHPHPQRGGSYTEAGGVKIPATSEPVKTTIRELIRHGELFPRQAQGLDVDGFDLENGTWEGLPRHGVMTEEEKEEMAAKTTEAKTEKKARKPKSRGASLEGLKVEDFFNTNAKGKVVFKPGYDAKYASLCKRIARGDGDTDDKRLFKSKGLSEHEKVEGSEHLRHLRDEARLAS